MSTRLLVIVLIYMRVQFETCFKGCIQKLEHLKYQNGYNPFLSYLGLEAI